VDGMPTRQKVPTYHSPHQSELELYGSISEGDRTTTIILLSVCGNMPGFLSITPY
jgi:hypothetical protein